MKTISTHRKQNSKKATPLYKDVKEIKIIFLILIGLILVGISGFSSYAIFTSEITSPNEIKGIVTQKTTGAETLIAKVGTGGLVAESHPETSQLQATTDYRYTGKDPDNYIKFNDEIWRIIGIFDTDDGTGKLEKRIKITRDPLGEIAWASGNLNSWSSASAKELLNNGDYYNRTGTYVSNGLTEEAKSYIADAKWYLGGTGSYDNSSNGLVSHFYNYERGNTVYSGRSISWIGKIGLIYVSDYGYATSGGTTKNRQTCLNNSLVSWDGRFDTDCWNNNWLYYSGSQWVMNSSSSDGYKVFHLRVNGIVNDTVYNAKDLVMMRPAIYLKTDISLTGEGTSTSPYEIE